MNLINTFELYLEKTVLSGTYWIVKSLLLLVFLSFLVNIGFDLKHWVYIKNFFALVDGNPNLSLCCYFWSDVEYQTTDIFMEKLQVWDTVHQANMRFRLVLPVLWKIFHSAAAIYALQVILGIAQIYMVLQIIYRLTSDRLQSFYFTLGFVGLYAGAAYYLDFYGYGDAFGYIFLTAAIYFRQPLLIALAIFLAAWVDERALLNSSFIIIFHWLAPYDQNRKTLVFNLFKPTLQAIAVIGGGIFYLIIRIYLTNRYQLTTPIGGPNVFFHVREASKSFGVRQWGIFEGFWLLIIGMVGSLWYRKNYVLLIVLLPLLLLAIFTVLLAGDYTRTVAYAFPILFIAIIVIKREFEVSNLRLILLSAGLLSGILFPIVY